MFWDDRHTQEKYFNFFRKLFKFETKMRFVDVDFSKPWWFLLWQQRGIVAINIVNVLIYSIIASLSPILLAQIFVGGNTWDLILLILGLILVRFINFALFYFDPILRLQSSKSIENSATNFFLTVDPVNHSLRSTGQIVSKVGRGSSSFETFLDIFSFNLLNLFGMVIGVVVAFWQVNLVLAILVAVAISLISFVNWFFYMARNKMFRRFRIQADDTSKAISLETLQQTQYIRAVFGTVEQYDKAKKSQFKSMVTAAVGWRLTGYVVSFSQILFLLSLLLVSILLLGQADIDKTIALSLIISYFQLGNSLNFVGQSFGRVVNSIDDVNDLYNFVREFGKQTYPVLETSHLKD